MTEQPEVTLHPCQVNHMPYLAWHEKAEQLAQQGERQQFCAICQRWQFADEQCSDFVAQVPQPKEEA